VPLSDVKIIDLTQVFAGPYCTYQLALLGAQIIKIEPPGGELTRFGGKISELAEQRLGLAYCTQNANKDCVELDLKDDQAVEKVLALASSADIFVQNYRPGVAERLGLGIQAIRRVNPQIIYCSISAYGGEGPIGRRPAYDHVVQAMSGIMATTGTDDMGPVKVGAPYIDYATGLNAAFALMAALRERDRTGEPQEVDISMLDTALNLMANNLVTVSNTGEDLPKLGNEAASGSPSSGCFQSSDGVSIMLAANNERQFVDLCHVLGHGEWLEDPRWANSANRYKHFESLREEIKKAFLCKPAKLWESKLDAKGVPASRVRSLNQLLNEGQPQARGLLATLPVGSEKTPINLPAIGFRLNGDSLAPTQAPKKVGEDNDRWLADLPSLN
jgi:crotonobetainyl-CoA:carnitine CoA-transferase CaiB-like acyl-CoA transferase